MIIILIIICKIYYISKKKGKVKLSIIANKNLIAKLKKERWTNIIVSQIEKKKLYFMRWGNLIIFSKLYIFLKEKNIIS